MQDDIRRALLLHAAAKAAGKIIDRDELRELLGAGEQHLIRGVIAANVGNWKASEPFKGTLTIGHDSQFASQPSGVAMAAILMREMAKTRLSALEQSLPAAFRELGGLPTADKDLEDRARRLFKACSSISTRRGAVSFQPEL